VWWKAAIQVFQCCGLAWYPEGTGGGVRARLVMGKKVSESVAWSEWRIGLLETVRSLICLKKIMASLTKVRSIVDIYVGSEGWNQVRVLYGLR